jgi:iron complex outermembrane recepter protein
MKKSHMLIHTRRKATRSKGNAMNRSASIAARFAVLASTTVLANGVAVAQSPEDTELDEIVVTAEKRFSTVQNTPISMTALSGDALQAQGTSSLLGVIREVPGLSIRSSGPGQTELEMRGLSSSAGSSATVGFYLGESALSPAAGSPTGKSVIDPDLFDLNRIEVLRGPQGTLYGSGSMGGTVKLVPNVPDATRSEVNIDSILSVTEGGGVNPGINAMFNLPIVDDKLAVRLVLTEKHRTGWIDRNVVANFPQPVNPCGVYGAVGCERGDLSNATITGAKKNANWSNLDGGRLGILFKPNDRVTITTTGMYQLLRLGGYDNYDENPGNTRAHYQPYDIKEPFRDRFSLVDTVIDYDVDFAQLTSATSYWSRVQRQTQDASEGLNSFFSNFFGVPGFVPVDYTQTDTSKQFSQELRLVSKGGSRFNWLVGGYFSKFKSIYNVYNANPAYADFSVGGAAENPDGVVFAANTPYRLTQYAAFGNASYELIDNLRLDVGLRWYRFDIDVVNVVSGLGTPSGNSSSTTFAAETKNSGVNPKVTLSYQPDRNLNIYATASKGFRPGGINPPIPDNFGCGLTDATFDQDNVWNLEVGEKAKLFGGAVTLNADMYYIKWTGAQQAVNQACGFVVFTNVGDAHAYGPEVELKVDLSKALSLSVAGTYTKAEITRVDPAVAAASDSIFDGSPILNIPEFTASASLNYRRAVRDNLDVTARLTSSYIGKSVDVSLLQQQLPAYNLVNARIGLVGERWAGFLFVDNLTNEVAKISVNTTAFAYPIPSLTRVSTNSPRTYGLNVNYRF